MMIISTLQNTRLFFQPKGGREEVIAVGDWVLQDLRV